MITTQEVEVKVASIGEAVGLQLGTKMVKDFFDAYPEHAQSYVIGKDIINAILAQPHCQGIILCPALDELGNKTMVYAGVDQYGKPITSYPVVTPYGTIKEEEGIVADRVRTGGGDGGGSTDLDW
jgi:hypothetical protein